MPFSSEDYQYGPIVVLKGKHKGRIGAMDDETTRGRRTYGVVKFCDPLLSPYYQYIPIENLDVPNTQQLLIRHEKLFFDISPFRGKEVEGADRIAALEEYSYISDLLNSRMFTAQFNHSPRGAKIFISHASADKTFVKGLAVDLAAIGHQPWVDEWEILAGESIPQRISSGIESADFLIVVLSKTAVNSQWVENEWQTKYWTEANEKRVTVIPIIIDDCDIPPLLRTKKHVDFRAEYTSSLEILAKSVGKLLARTQQR